MRISIEGIGSENIFWSPVTNELFFATQLEPNSSERQVYRTTYQEVDGKFVPNPDGPVPWEGAVFYQKNSSSSYALHPDGNRSLVRKLAEVEDEEDEEEQSFDQVVLFENFAEHLRKNVPTGKN